MIWRHPLAWLGLATLLIPIAIHLLVRQQAQPMAFPSLRFLETSRLAAVRRRKLSDWLLLAVRLLILAAAVAALADPFVLTASRRAMWAGRVARAIIVDTAAGTGAIGEWSGAAAGAVEMPVRPGGAAAAGAGVDGAERAAGLPVIAAAAVRAEQASAFASTVIPAADLQAGVARGLAWLSTAPPAAREIVIISPLTRGRVPAAMSEALPRHVGLRFTRVGAPLAERAANGRPASMRSESRPDAGFETRRPAVTVRADSTDVRWETLVREGTARSAPDAAALAMPGASAPAAVAAGVGADAGKGVSAGGAIAIAAEGSALRVRALGLRVEAAAREMPAARAALEAVLSEGIPVAGQDARPVVIVLNGGADTHAVKHANTDEQTEASTRGDAQAPLATPLPLSAPWMADALQAIADDRQLAESITSSDAAMRDAIGTGGRDANGAKSATTMAQSGSAVQAARGQADPKPQLAPEPYVLFRAMSGQPVVTASATRLTDDGATALRLTSIAPAESDVTALLLRAVLRATADIDPLPAAEVARIPDAQLAAWQRPAELPPVDELSRIETHDRRWFWGAALALLLIERLLRARLRRREPGIPEVAHAA